MCYHFHAAEYAPSFVADFLDVRPELYQHPLPFGPFYPISKIPVVREREDGDRELVGLEWGLLPSWWKPSGRQLKRTGFQRKCVNARSETAHEKPSFRSAFKSRRCLLLVDKFFDGGRWFHLPDNQPFTFAGLWESWSDGDDSVESCTMLTTAANSVVAEVHDRMPVMFSSEQERKEWLSPDLVDRESLEHLFVPYSGELLFVSGGKLG